MTSKVMNDQARVNRKVLRKAEFGLHAEMWRRRQEWTICVATERDASAEEIATKWPYRGKHMYSSTNGTLSQAGFEVVPDPGWDGDVHSLLMLPEEPTEELWEALRACFGSRMDNPSYVSRRR